MPIIHYNIYSRSVPKIFMVDKLAPTMMCDVNNFQLSVNSGKKAPSSTSGTKIEKFNFSGFTSQDEENHANVKLNLSKTQEIKLYPQENEKNQLFTALRAFWRHFNLANIIRNRPSKFSTRKQNISYPFKLNFPPNSFRLAGHFLYNIRSFSLQFFLPNIPGINFHVYVAESSERE